MRIISGVCKGIPLKAVPGQMTRPTTDKVKESMFNMIGPFFQSGNALDLFAGSGSLGIESLSRGMENVVFVERNKIAFKVIMSNLERSKLTNKATVYNYDVNFFFRQFANNFGKLQFDYVFIDPPYAVAKNIPFWIEKLEKCQLLAKNCWLICEHGKDILLPKKIGNAKCIRENKYGNTCLTIYETNY